MHLLQLQVGSFPIVPPGKPQYRLYVESFLKNGTNETIYKTEIRVTDVENEFTVTKSEVGER